jgi:hypothetical protein
VPAQDGRGVVKVGDNFRAAAAQGAGVVPLISLLTDCEISGGS